MKKFWSHALNRHFDISVSMKALKCIRKKGSLDKYLLETDTREIRSKFGELLQSHIKKKLENPDWVPNYIPGTRRAWKSTREADKKRFDVIWKPPETRYKDHTEYEFNRYDPNAPPRPEPLKKDYVPEKRKPEPEEEEEELNYDEYPALKRAAQKTAKFLFALEEPEKKVEIEKTPKKGTKVKRETKKEKKKKNQPAPSPKESELIKGFKKKYEKFRPIDGS
jgi:hypothetical protein